MKFEGTVNNSTSPLVSTSAPVNAAFFAKVVNIKKGPVIPPNVPYQPYVAPTVYHKGQNTLKGLFKVDHIPSNLAILRRTARGGEVGQEVAVMAEAHRRGTATVGGDPPRGHFVHRP